jgi:hypothetical protein
MSCKFIPISADSARSLPCKKFDSKPNYVKWSTSEVSLVDHQNGGISIAGNADRVPPSFLNAELSGRMNFDLLKILSSLFYMCVSIR